MKTQFSGSRIPSRNPADLPRPRSKSLPDESSEPSRGFPEETPPFPPFRTPESSRKVRVSIRSSGSFPGQNPPEQAKSEASSATSSAKLADDIADDIPSFQSDLIRGHHRLLWPMMKPLSQGREQAIFGTNIGYIIGYFWPMMKPISGGREPFK